jgi:phage baseplate assembly protein V
MNDYSGELDRRIGNIVTAGTIAAVDTANALAKVALDDSLITDWLPWIASRAGTTRTWSAPSVGEQVLLLSPSGELTQGVILMGLYQDAHAQPSTDANKITTVYPDGSKVEYDASSNTLTVDVAASGNVVVNCKVATIKADTSVTLDTPQTTAKGALTVEGLLTYQNGIAGQSGTNGSAITGTLNITSGDVVADSISLKNHKTSGVTSGSQTSGVPVP